jgi:hypothetical protein
MTQKEFARIIKDDLYATASDIRNAKQPEYTMESEDILNNFKQAAKRAGVSPMQVWSIFFDKQLSSIQAHIKNPNLVQAEPLDSRWADLYNYLLLGFALHKESVALKE